MSDQVRKLLIVDDDPGIRSQLKWGFEGYEIFTAEDRSHALEQFSKHNPPVVTLDLGLPPDKDGISEGYKILEQILSKAPDTKVIVVSASEEGENRRRAVASGAFDYYPKPIRLEQLAEIIERAYQDYKNNN